MPDPITLVALGTAAAKYGPQLAVAADKAKTIGDAYARKFESKEDQAKVRGAVTIMSILMKNVVVTDLLPSSFSSAEGVPAVLEEKTMFSTIAAAVSSEKSVGPASLYNPRWIPNQSDFAELFVQDYDETFTGKREYMIPVYECHERLLRMVFNSDGSPNTKITPESRRTAFIFLKAIDGLIKELNTPNSKMSLTEAHSIMLGLKKSLDEALCTFPDAEGKVLGEGSKEYLRKGKDTSLRARVGFGRGLEEGDSLAKTMEIAADAFEKQFLLRGLSEIVTDISENLEADVLEFMAVVCKKFGGTVPDRLTTKALSEIQFEGVYAQYGAAFDIFRRHYSSNFSETDEEALRAELKSCSPKTKEGEQFVIQLMELFRLAQLSRQISNIQEVSKLMGSLTERDMMPLYETFFKLLQERLKSSMVTMQSLNDNSERAVSLDHSKYLEIQKKLDNFNILKRTVDVLLNDHIPDLEKLTRLDENLHELNDNVDQIKRNIATLNIDEERRLELYALVEDQRKQAIERVARSKNATLQTMSKSELKILKDNATLVQDSVADIINGLRSLALDEKSAFAQLLSYVDQGFSSHYIDHSIESGAVLFQSEASLFSSVEDLTGLDKKILVKLKPEEREKINKQFIELVKQLCKHQHAASGQDGMSAKDADRSLQQLQTAFRDFNKTLQEHGFSPIANPFEKRHQAIADIHDNAQKDRAKIQQVQPVSQLSDEEQKELAYASPVKPKASKPAEEVSSINPDPYVQRNVREVAFLMLCIAARDKTADGGIGDYVKKIHRTLQHKSSEEKESEVLELNSGALYQAFWCAVHGEQLTAGLREQINKAKTANDPIFKGLANISDLEDKKIFALLMLDRFSELGKLLQDYNRSTTQIGELQREMIILKRDLQEAIKQGNSDRVKQHMDQLLELDKKLDQTQRVFTGIQKELENRLIGPEGLGNKMFADADKEFTGRVRDDTLIPALGKKDREVTKEYTSLKETRGKVSLKEVLNSAEAATKPQIDACESMRKECGELIQNAKGYSAQQENQRKERYQSAQKELDKRMETLHKKRARQYDQALEIHDQESAKIYIEFKLSKKLPVLSEEQKVFYDDFIKRGKHLEAEADYLAEWRLGRRGRPDTGRVESALQADNYLLKIDESIENQTNALEQRRRQLNETILQMEKNPPLLGVGQKNYDKKLADARKERNELNGVIEKLGAFPQEFKETFRPLVVGSLEVFYKTIDDISNPINRVEAYIDFLKCLKAQCETQLQFIDEKRPEFKYLAQVLGEAIRDIDAGIREKQKELKQLKAEEKSSQVVEQKSVQDSEVDDWSDVPQITRRGDTFFEAPDSDQLKRLRELGPTPADQKEATEEEIAQRLKALKDSQPDKGKQEIIIQTPKKQ